MDPHDIKQIIQFIEVNCQTTLSAKQSEQLRGMKQMGTCNIYQLRTLYRIAIANFVYPECPCCKKPITTQETLTIDHIVPKAKGGSDDIENLQPMHKSCNSKKGCELLKTDVPPAEIHVEKHRKKHNGSKHKERTFVKARTPDELYQKCKKIDQARANKYRASTHVHIK